MRRKLRLVIALLLVGAYLFAMGSAVYAQTFPPLVGVVADDTGNLDTDAVNAAAEALTDLGVQPLAVLAQNQPDPDDDAFARTVAQNYGYINGGVVDPDLLSIVVSLNQRRFILLYGDNLRPIFEDTSRGETPATTIRNKVGPLLAAGVSASANGNKAEASEKLTEAFITGLTEAAGVIDLYRNPPTPTPRPTPEPTATPQPPINIDMSGLGTALLWVVGIIVALGLLAVLGPVGWRAWRRAQESAARRRALEEQLVQARNVAADMITDLDFPADPAEQLQYRFLALVLGNERPEELAQLQGRYREMYDRVSGALARYNAANSAKHTTEEEITAGIGQYQGIQSEINLAATFLKEMAERSRQVEGQIASAPGEVEEAKKALAAATGSLERLAAAPDLYKADPEKVTAGVNRLIGQAQEALRSEPARPLNAYDEATSARDSADRILSLVQRIGTAYSALGDFRGMVEGHRKRGYKLPSSNEHDSSLLALLSRAAEGLEGDGDPALFENIMRSVDEGLGKARTTVDTLVGQHRSNEQALAHLQKAGEELKEYIAEGARAFDKVDEYAESSWADIRGNGTEAQKAANRAQGLWEEATALNALQPDGAQDFERAAELVGEAGDSIRKSRDLVTAILERLKNIEESKRTAGAEIEAAGRDIEAGQSFVAQHDRDITPKPSDMLKEAARLLAEAKEEARKEKPDWIDVARQARAANDTADKALADARSQQEAMQALMRKVDTSRQQAEAALSRAANFASVHSGDLGQELFKALERARADFEKVQAKAAQVGNIGLEDVALGRALGEVVGQLGAAQGEADRVYGAAQEQFQAMENLRGQAHAAIRRAGSVIEQANLYTNMYDGEVGYEAKNLLRQARNTLPEWRDRASADELRSMLAAANRAQALAAQAYRQARDDVEAHEAALEAEEEERRRQEWREREGGILGGLLIGGSGGDSNDSGSSGGSWSWGSGSSGGSSGGGFSWGSGGSGSGGSSSGGFGGGGSSSGSFGGGGSSSGS
ncbi:MAG: hypothetical protein WCD37_14990, partial [Chloroflexia bacterium]